MSPIYKAYLEHENALKRFLWQFYKRAEDVEDAAQEVFLRSFRAELESEIKNPKAFLFRVARNYALSDLARKSNSEVDFFGDSNAPTVLKDDRQFPADNHLASKQALALLVRAVAELPPKCRRIFIMRKFEGMSVKDIAQTLSVSVSNVDNQLSIGLERTMRYLRDHGIDDESIGRAKHGKAPHK